MKDRRRISAALASAATAAVLGLAACGGDDGGGGGGGTGGEEPTGAAASAKALTPNQAQNAKGEVGYCIGGSLEGHTQVVAAFNKQGAAQAKIIKLGASADDQRQQQIQRLQAKSPECDVLAMDVIHTAEYANQGWVFDLTQVAEPRRGEFIESTLNSATYQDKVWAIPNNSNAGFLYYRKNAAQQPPETWQQVYEMAKQGDGLVYQGARYEGLTVNFLELLFSAGGTVLSEDGKQSQVDSQQARDVLNFMVQGVQGGAVPKSVTTLKEDEARRLFETGKASFMRNWPYAYSLGNKTAIKGKFDIAPFPAYEGGEAAGVLGGFNLGVSAYSDNPGGALAFINYYASPEAQRTIATKASLPPVLIESYDDPAVKKALPFAADLRQAIEQAQPRPVSPVYSQITQAIYENVHSALTGRMQVDEAVTQMNQGIQQALETF